MRFRRAQAGGMLPLTWLLIAVLSLPLGCRSRKPPVVLAGSGEKPKQVVKNASAEDDKAVRAVYERYWEHIAKKEGPQAATCLDQATLDWHDKIRADALKLTREELAKQDLLRQMTILIWRTEFDKATLASKTGKELLGLGYERGWLEEQAKVKPTLAYVGSNGKTAHALYEGGSDLPSFFFEKEADGWKINQTLVHERVRSQLLAGLVNSGQDEQTFLKRQVTNKASRKFDERVFDGPLEKTLD